MIFAAVVRDCIQENLFLRETFFYPNRSANIWQYRKPVAGHFRVPSTVYVVLCDMNFIEQKGAYDY